MNVTVELDNASSFPNTPALEDFQHWSGSAMSQLNIESETQLSIRLIEENESAALNQKYREKEGPTNILSFPISQDIQFPDNIRLLGDLAICVAIVEKEASGQDNSLQAHWAHLTVHGVLHLNGYDHENDDEAQQMESLESKIMMDIGFADPYKR